MHTISVWGTAVTAISFCSKLSSFLQDRNYGGSVTTFEGGTYPNLDGPESDPAEECGNGWLSYKCRCNMDPINCTPDDEYQVVVQCDNTESAEVTECNYIKVQRLFVTY